MEAEEPGEGLIAGSMALLVGAGFDKGGVDIDDGHAAHDVADLSAADQAAWVSAEPSSILVVRVRRHP
jgi:hypothetical protein